MTTIDFHRERVATPTGPMLIVTDDEDRLRAADWEDFESRMLRLLDRRYGAAGFRLHEARRASAARRALDAYFAGELAAVTQVPAVLAGTTFQRNVWDALRTIPAGRTLTYGGVAQRLGCPQAVRAVGLANGANGIVIFYPCHRVVGSNGSLTGFGGGLHRKRWLLAHEGGETFGPELSKTRTLRWRSEEKRHL